MRIQRGINQENDFIRIQDPDEAFRMLGGFVAPDGNTRVQLEILYKKANEWRLRLTFSHLNAHEAWVTYHQVLIPSLIYPLGAIPVGEADCIKIMGPALKALLPKLEMSATTARDLVHGPIRFGTPDITNIYTEAGGARIKMFIGHWRKDDETANILRISMGCCQQEVGLGQGPLEQDFRKYGWILQPCWVKELWRFLDDINGKIVIDDDWVQTRCERDVFLMNIVHDMALSKDQIKKINLCRLFKRVTFISDTLHHERNQFIPDLWDPSVQLPINPKERFPIIQVPDNYWPLWTNVLKSIRSSHIIQIRNIGTFINKQDCKC